MAFWNKNTNEEKEKPGFFDRLKQGLSKTRTGLTGKLDKLLSTGKAIDEDLLDELEEILYTSDLGVVAVQELIEMVRMGVARRNSRTRRKLKRPSRKILSSFLTYRAPQQNICLHQVSPL